MEAMENFFGIASGYTPRGQETLLRKRPTLYDNSNDGDEFEKVSFDPEDNRIRSEPKVYKICPKSERDSFLLMDWSLVTEMIICSSFPLPLSFSSSDLSFEKTSSLMSGKSPLELQMAQLLPYYIYPPQASLKSHFCTVTQSSSCDWTKVFICIFHQFEYNNQPFFFLNGNFTLLFLYEGGTHFLRIRSVDRRIINSLVENNIISLPKEPAPLEPSVSSELLSELAELETLSPGSTRLHESGRLFSQQKTNTQNRMIKEKPIVISSILEIRRAIYYRDKNDNEDTADTPLPIIIAQCPFIGGTLSLPAMVIEKPIKIIRRHPDTGDIIEQISYKYKISGIIMPRPSFAIINAINALAEDKDMAREEYTISIEADLNTCALNCGGNEIADEVEFNMFRSQVHRDASSQTPQVFYAPCNLPTTGNFAI